MTSKLNRQKQKNRELRKQLRAALPSKAFRWFAVEERLPKEYVSVLIYHTDVPPAVGPIIAFRVGDLWTDDLQKRPQGFQVTHWGFLPKVPK